MKIKTEKAEGQTITLSAPNLIGYQVSYYAFAGHKNGKGKLDFMSAERTIDGRTTKESQRPALRFSLPEGSQYQRLIYFVRVSASDHNMAIAAARNKKDLALLTTQVKENVEACRTGRKVFCTWVPAGVSVRPEALNSQTIKQQ